jgi:hypothetical protein
MEPKGSLPCSQRPVHLSPFVTLRNELFFLRCGVVNPSPHPQAGGPPPVGCLPLLIQYIHSYPPQLEVASSIRNLRTRHVVVTGTHITSPSVGRHICFMFILPDLYMWLILTSFISFHNTRSFKFCTHQILLG